MEAVSQSLARGWKQAVWKLRAIIDRLENTQEEQLCTVRIPVREVQAAHREKSRAWRGRIEEMSALRREKWNRR